MIIERIKRHLKVGVWNVGFIVNSVGDVLQGKPYEIIWMKHNFKDRFFADPFLFKSDDLYYYVLAEELKFYEMKGRIVLLKVDKKTYKLWERKCVIDESYHLSYPNFDNNCIIPEGYQSGGVYSYTISDNSLIKRRIANYPVIDPTFVTFNGIKWLFGTTKMEPIDAKSKLSIFYEENGEFIPHKKNPIKNDICTARPGGRFFEFEKTLYRPVQDSSRIYGGQTRIMKVCHLDKDDYIEEEVAIVSSSNSDDYNIGLHTFNVYEGIIIVDGYSFKTPLSKIVYMKMPKIWSYFSDSNDGMSVENR